MLINEGWYNNLKSKKSQVLYEKLSRLYTKNDDLNLLNEATSEQILKRIKQFVDAADPLRVRVANVKAELETLLNTKGTTASVKKEFEKVSELLKDQTKAIKWVENYDKALTSPDVGAETLGEYISNPEKFSLPDVDYKGNKIKTTKKQEPAKKQEPEQQQSSPETSTMKKGPISRSPEQARVLVKNVESSEQYYKKISDVAEKVKELYVIHTDNYTQPLDRAEFYSGLNKLLTDVGSPKTYDMGDLSVIFSKEITAAMPQGAKAKEWLNLLNDLGLTVAKLPQRFVEFVSEATKSKWVRGVFSTVVGIGVAGYMGLAGYEYFMEERRTFNRNKCLVTLRTAKGKEADYKGLPAYEECVSLILNILSKKPKDSDAVNQQNEFKQELKINGLESYIPKKEEAPAPAPAPAPTPAPTTTNIGKKFKDSKGSTFEIVREEGDNYIVKDNKGEYKAPKSNVDPLLK